MSYIGYDYLCMSCNCSYVLSYENLVEVEIQHTTGEQLTITINECPHCGSMAIPEGLNQISWRVGTDEL